MATFPLRPLTGTYPWRVLSIAAQNKLASQLLAAAALLATLTVLVLAIAVQKDFLAPSRRPELLRLWGEVAVLGTVVWLVSSPFAAALARPAAAPAVRPGRWSARVSRTILSASGAALVLGLGALVEDLASALGVWLWLLGMGGVVLGLAVREVSWPGWRPAAWLRERTFWDWLGRATVGLAFALRLVYPNEVPAFINFDEAQTGEWGLGVYHHWLVPAQQVPATVAPFQTGILGTPIAGYYLYVAIMQVVGETVAGLHFPSAVTGGLTVWVVWRLLREYVRAPAAVGGALLLAFSHQFLFWTRTGIAVGPVALTTAAAVWLVLRGMRGERLLPWVVAGLGIGAATHFYWSSSAILPVLALFFGCQLARAPVTFVKERWLQLLALGLAAFIAFAPLGIWYAQQRGAATERAGNVMFLNNEEYRNRMYPGLTVGQIFLQQIDRSLWGLVSEGDGTPQHYPMRRPLVDPVLGAVLLVGMFGFTLTAGRPERMLVALWFWVPTLLVVLFTDRPPPMTRLLIVVPAVCAVAGFALDRIVALAERVGGRSVLAALAVPALIGTGYMAYWNVNNYFFYYPIDSPRDRWTELVRVINEAGPTYKTYSLGGQELMFQKEHIHFLARRQVGDTIDLTQSTSVPPIAERGNRNVQFVIGLDRADVVTRLRQLYPGGVFEERQNNLGRPLFFTYRVPAATFDAAAPPTATWFQPDARVGRMGRRYGEMYYPFGVAVGSDGTIYAADGGNGRVVTYDGNGEPGRMYGRRGEGNGEFRGLSHVAVGTDGVVYGLDQARRQVQRFAPDGRWTGAIGFGALREPVGIALAPDATLVVADAGRPGLLRFAPDGGLLQQVDAAGSGPGQLDKATGVAVGADGTVYTADATGRVQRFDAAFRFLGQFDGGLGRPERVVSIAVSDVHGGAVYLSAPNAREVYRYSKDGRRELTIGPKWDGTPSLMEPSGLATDAQGNLYVLDARNYFISRYDIPKRPR